MRWKKLHAIEHFHKLIATATVTPIDANINGSGCGQNIYISRYGDIEFMQKLFYIKSISADDT